MLRRLNRNASSAATLAVVVIGHTSTSRGFHQNYQQHHNNGGNEFGGGGGGYAQHNQQQSQQQGNPQHQHQQHGRGGFGGGGGSYRRGGGGHFPTGNTHQPSSVRGGGGHFPTGNTHQPSSVRGGGGHFQQHQGAFAAGDGNAHEGEEGAFDDAETNEDEGTADEEEEAMLMAEGGEEGLAAAPLPKIEVPELKITITDHTDSPVRVQPLKQFEHLCEDIPEWLANGIRSSGYREPMPVQAHSIPLLMEGRDVIAVAPTGSGKTVAFAIPALGNIKLSESVRGTNRASPSVLVLCPTRELVQQTHKVMTKLSQPRGPMILAAFGGADRETQAKYLRRGADVVVAAPGRLCDFLEDDVVSLEKLDFLVLDEADRMLEMGFAPALSMITGCLNKSRPRVTMMWSATWSTVVGGLAAKFLNPNRLMINCEGDGNKANKNITQKVYSVGAPEDRLDVILSLYNDNVISKGSKVIIFAKKKEEIQPLVDSISAALGAPPNVVQGLHGALKQMKRAAIIQAFREGHIRILVATDIAGRGLDVPFIDHVINYDLPLHFDSYVHRIGRTGRAGNKGMAHTIICSRDSSAVIAELGDYYDANNISYPEGLKYTIEKAKYRGQQRRSRYTDHGKMNGKFWKTKGVDPNSPPPPSQSFGGGRGGGFHQNRQPRAVPRV